MAITDMIGNKFGRIGVLMGGPSSERDISLKSGMAVYGALQQAGLEVVAIDINTDETPENIALIDSYRINCAFIALHGAFGEDGRIQKILEKLDIPYTGSGVKASTLAMDKVSSRKIFSAAGLNVPRFLVVEKAAYKSSLRLDNLGWPLVIKPATHGSSIGLSIIEREDDFSRALDFAFDYDDRAIVEEYIQGRELTVGILDEQPLSIIEIIPKRKFFDYEAKYKPGMTEYMVPAQLEEGLSQKVQQAALCAHKLLGCFGCSRVDIILNRVQVPCILEINSIPGLTATSLLPKAARDKGIGFTQLCLKLIELAYAKKSSPAVN
jgi:D-alanine-D-alanine ligase